MAPYQPLSSLKTPLTPGPLGNTQTTTPMTAFPTPTAQPSSMGVVAKTPQANIKQPSNVIPTNTQQVTPVPTQQRITPPTPSATAVTSQQPSSYNGGLYGQLIQKAIASQDASQRFTQGLNQSSNDLTKQNIALPFVQGQQAALQRDYGVQQQALAQQGTNAINAAGLAAPVQVSPGNTLNNPVTGEQVAGGLGGYANYQTAQQVFNQASQYKDAVNSQGQPFTYDQNASPQQNWQTFSTQYLPNSRTYQSSLNSAGLTSNIGQPSNGTNPLAQSTINQTNQGGYKDAYTQYQDVNAQYEGAKNLGGLLTNTMAQYGINPSEVKVLNTAIKDINNQLSNKGYTRFLSTLQNVQSAYANILTTGGGTIPTAATNALHTIIDPNASLGAVQSAIDQLNNEVITGKLVPLANQSNQYLDSLNQGAGGNTATSGSGGSYTSQSGKSYNLPY